LSTTKIKQNFPISQSKCGPGPKFKKSIPVRFQFKSNKIRHSPEPVQSKSSPMLISADQCANFGTIYPKCAISQTMKYQENWCSGIMRSKIYS